MLIIIFYSIFDNFFYITFDYIKYNLINIKILIKI
jgi:hypothetical protein